MRATYIRKILTQTWATHAAAGNDLTHAMREVAALLGRRAAHVLAVVLQVKTTINIDGEVGVALGHAQLIDHVHGQIQLTGPHGTGLVPVAMRASDIAAINGAQGFLANMLTGQVGGLVPSGTYPIDDTAIESTLVLAYAPRAMSVAPIAHGSIHDGAIDTALFGPSTTLQVQGLGAPIGDHVFHDTILDVYVVYGTSEPGQYLVPSRPQYKKLGSVQNDPQIFGLGQRSDLQTVVLTTQDNEDAGDTQNAIRASAAMMSVELDGTELSEGPGRVISRAPLQSGAGGMYAMVGAAREPKWLTLWQSCQVPQASERHVGQTIQLEGLNVEDASRFLPQANAYYTQSADNETINEWCRLRGIDRSKLAGAQLAGGKGLSGAGLSPEQAVGISPTVR